MSLAFIEPLWREATSGSSVLSLCGESWKVLTMSYLNPLLRRVPAGCSVQLVFLGGGRRVGVLSRFLEGRKNSTGSRDAEEYLYGEAREDTLSAFGCSSEER